MEEVYKTTFQFEIRPKIIDKWSQSDREEFAEVITLLMHKRSEESTCHQGTHPHHTLTRLVFSLVTLFVM